MITFITWTIFLAATALVSYLNVNAVRALWTFGPWLAVLCAPTIALFALMVAIS
jgi:hypothetical protein